MKTALELLGDYRCGGCDSDLNFCQGTLELVARRAREEAYRIAADEALMSDETRANLAARIRALPTEPK